MNSPIPVFQQDEVHKGGYSAERAIKFCGAFLDPKDIAFLEKKFKEGAITGKVGYTKRDSSRDPQTMCPLSWVAYRRGILLSDLIRHFSFWIPLEVINIFQEWFYPVTSEDTSHYFPQMYCLRKGLEWLKEGNKKNPSVVLGRKRESA